MSTPAPEISGDTTKLDLPVIPGFARPTPIDGRHSPFELLVVGDRLRGTRVQVGGYITWIYDCTTALARPGKTRAQIRRMIDDDPSQCERPKFYLGNTSSTPPGRSLWVVDVPRPPFKVEKERLPADELANWPTVPKLAVGAYVEVTGTFAVQSPHNERNSDGLIIYESIDTAKPARARPTFAAMPEATLPPLPELPPPARSAPPIDAAASIGHSNAGARAYGIKQYDTAIAEYEAALHAWDGNHSAWYGLSGVRASRGDWKGAAEAAAHCVALAPDQAMYWLLRGRMLYEATIQEAREQEASKQGRPIDEVIIDRSALDVTPAVHALLMATHLDDRLWRAHYYLGRIFRDRGEARSAAAQLTEAIALHASDPAPFIALCELYRRWQYRDEAVAVAELGSRLLPSSAEIWFELGMGYDDRGDHGKAITGFSRALEVKPDFAVARFQRGQAYFHKKDLAHARRDLEDFVRAGGPSFEVMQAKQMLADIRH